MKRREFLKAAAVLTTSTAVSSRLTHAQDRNDVLYTTTEGGPNSFDGQFAAANRSSYEVTWNVYDRLISSGVRKDENGNDRYDPSKFVPELAEEWDIGDKSITFKLRKNATFHDGSPVTAQDVKWSFDRAATMPGLPKATLQFPGMGNPEQFVVVDDYTFRVDLNRKDRLVMPTIACPMCVIFNSGLAKKHATESEPWAVDWLKNNTAAGGAYKVVSKVGDQQVVYVRNDDWKSGPLPQFQKVIWQTIPSTSMRLALLERGDVDVSMDLPPKDASEMVKSDKVKVIGTLMQNTVQSIGMNVKKPPFDNLKVRQAIGYAIPYDDILKVAIYNRGRKLSGGPATVTSPVWPQPDGYRTDLAKAKQLLAEAGHPNGFEVQLSFDASAAATNEPMCELIQENLGKIGVKVTLDKIAGSGWRAALRGKQLIFLTNLFGAWFDFPEFYFDFSYHSRNEIFNISSYQNPEMDKLIDASRVETDPAKYDDLVKKYIQLAFDDLPAVPVFQPLFDVAMQKNISGYRYWYHRQLDYRTLRRT